MNGLVQSIALGILRNAATAAGGYLVAHNFLQSGQVNDFLGSVLFLGGVAFTVIDKLVVHKRVAVALATPAPGQGA